ncbi:single-stranded DNA-binding protein [Photobacterium carnosum]|uniref:Single-stranded DNA-binding protein n=1 Tax=Photobacterium carnosum TaxID=2023717 RepID=A0A2N4UWR0_9GAMM|nr:MULTISPECIES: single-stranded DNA-binding protein [Photobacterium]MCD9476339.1 single-stranded DNA-binding protein [Photobacterium phosphoreum]MCD9488888.1 single-stranded DNA-binding protein [Photobacterium iliopiscarium]MCD9508115.1 single-stranded DNA-binding protein [Photobacterium phosphoreum]MCD9539328.1 single-stranded DNA-binding protein [Photobacterium carnosum]MCD9542310.1 single-stranded DNA-binding protein [Photobacterium carnosum]
MIKFNCNTITFGGTLGKDLEVKDGTNGSKPFGFVSCVQTTSWSNNQGGFNERATWMTLKFNDSMIQKIDRNGGFFKGDEVIVEGYLVQRKGTNNNTIIEIQVQNVIAHLPKAIRDLAKQSGYNAPAQPVYPAQPVQQQQQYSQPVQQQQQYSQPVQQQQPQCSQPVQQQFIQQQQFVPQQPVQQQQQQYSQPVQQQQPQYSQPVQQQQQQYSQPVQQQQQQYSQPVQQQQTQYNSQPVQQQQQQYSQPENNQQQQYSQPTTNVQSEQPTPTAAETINQDAPEQGHPRQSSAQVVSIQVDKPQQPVDDWFNTDFYGGSRSL